MKQLIFLQWLSFIISLFVQTSNDYLSDLQKSFTSDTTSKCKTKDCKTKRKKALEKAKIRKRIIKRLINPFSRLSTSIETDFQEQQLKAEEFLQLNSSVIKNYLDKLKEFMANQKQVKVFEEIAPLPQETLSNSVFANLDKTKKVSQLSTPTFNVSFQKGKYDVYDYLQKINFQINAFWNLIKQFLFSDIMIFSALRTPKLNECNPHHLATPTNVIHFSPDINFSPLEILYSPTDKRKVYYLEVSIPVNDCSALRRLKISEKNTLCQNLALLNLYGSCTLLPLFNRFNFCFASSNNFFKKPCKTLYSSFKKLTLAQRRYIRAANFIFKNQALPFYFSVFLSARLPHPPIHTNVYPYILYREILKDYFNGLANLQMAIPKIQEQLPNLFIEKTSCNIPNDLPDYFQKILHTLTSYKEILYTLESLKKKNPANFKISLPKAFPTMLKSLSVDVQFKYYFALWLKTNLNYFNAQCLFKILQFILTQIYQYSNYLVFIDPRELLFGTDPMYKTILELSHISSREFSLTNLFTQSNSLDKLQEIFLLDYKLAILFQYYSMEKCSQKVTSFEEFLTKYHHSKKEVEKVACLLRNFGNLEECDSSESSYFVSKLTENLHIQKPLLQSISLMANEIKSKMMNSPLFEVDEEFQMCCKKGCSIPRKCNDIDVKSFCKPCQNKDCNTINNPEIENTIKECCNSGIIPNVDSSKQETPPLDPCKLAYKIENGTYKWVYPQLKCNIGTDEQKKCLSLILNTSFAKLSMILDMLLKDSEGNPDEGKSFCQQPKAKLDEVCCNRFKTCSICSALATSKFCFKTFADFISERDRFIQKLKELTSESFVEFLKGKIIYYSTKGFPLEGGCDNLR